VIISETDSTAQERRATSACEAGRSALEHGYAVLEVQPALSLELAQFAAAAARELDDPTLAGRALALEMRVAIRRGDFERALELVVEAEQFLACSDAPELFAELTLAIAALTFNSGGYHDGLARAEEALAVADEHALERAMLDARGNLVWMLGSMGLPESLDVARDMAALARKLEQPYDEARARNDIAYNLFKIGQFEDAAAEIEPAIEMAKSLGPSGRYAVAYALGTRADIRLSSGDARSALADADEVLRLIEDGDEPDPYLRAITHEVRMRCFSALGQATAALEAGYQGLTVAGPAMPFLRGMILRGVAGVLHEANRPKEAYEALAEGSVLEREVLEQQAQRQVVLLRTRLMTAAARHEAVALAARNDELSALVEELTATKSELQRRMQRDAQFAAIERRESLARVAGGVAHDFNNLLQGVLGNAELLDAYGLDETQSRYLAGVRTSAEQAAKLSEQMLVYAEGAPPALEAINLADVVTELRPLFDSLAVVKADLTVAVTDVWVHGDKQRLSQVLLNLLMNALEAIGDRRGTIELRVTGDKHQAAITVADNGSGMDEETQRRMFDPFFSTKFTGRGLGLAAVEGIVRSHGGEIAVVSEISEGTSVVVSLPALPSPGSLSHD
jgi:signal transduction histidine kinase